MKVEDVWAMGPAEWRALLRDGHPIDPDALAGWSYRGTSLGMPAIVDRVTWKTFQKCFHRDDAGVMRGWNVRLVQDGTTQRGAPSEPQRDRRGEPVTFGHFRVVPARDRGVPHGFDRGLLLDYGGLSARAIGPLSRLRDPIVALRAGDADLLLGWSYLAALGRTIDTPSFFTLEREARTAHVPLTCTR
ncbi:hypothetical protein [Sandaracinus amylolyticus]|uniref:hypothetical protein n=1 Tax=Sandaracinus amylolyticus TaxID=927083 RepID=UPI001F3A345D|nr:hypothetical protein [Sandaracinus amylolyticus]UJR86970.1 Hypothetical protein I5071_90710 [Sandaracinus amylolyticus]